MGTNRRARSLAGDPSKCGLSWSRYSILAAFLTAVLVGSIAGCNRPFSGKFQDANGFAQYEFRNDGRALVTQNGATATVRYELKGDRIMLTTERGMWVLARDGESFIEPDGRRLRPLR